MIHFELGWPQIIYILLFIWSIVDVTLSHGKPKQGNYNAWSYLISALLMFSLLAWGGFFS